MSNLLKSEDFGLKLYNRFPYKYREDDEKYNYALKRYIESLADGGFKYSIDEINGITTLIDPENVSSKVLPILFKEYGLDVFNGIPESYLRYLLPKLGEVWSKKGSISAVEFITSSISGIKTSTETQSDEDGNPIIDIKLEMDYNIGEYFPESEQLRRLISNFVPFNSDLNIIYSYQFFDSSVFSLKEAEILELIKDTRTEKGIISVAEEYYNKTSVISRPFEDSIGFWNTDLNSVTNSSYQLLNGSFVTNGLTNYDVITTLDGKKEIIY